jgi:hypothetical protein
MLYQKWQSNENLMGPLEPFNKLACEHFASPAARTFFCVFIQIPRPSGDGTLSHQHHTTHTQQSMILLRAKGDEWLRAARV